MISAYDLQEQIKNILAANLTLQASNRPTSFFIEMMDREEDLRNMPLINVRLDAGDLELVSIPDSYYVTPKYLIDIVTFDLSEFRIAARLRDNLLEAAMTAIISARKATLAEVLTIGPEVKYGAGVPEQGGGHLAIGTFQVVAQSYSN